MAHGYPSQQTFAMNPQIAQFQQQTGQLPTSQQDLQAFNMFNAYNPQLSQVGVPLGAPGASSTVAPPQQFVPPPAAAQVEVAQPTATTPAAAAAASGGTQLAGLSRFNDPVTGQMVSQPVQRDPAESVARSRLGAGGPVATGGALPALGGGGGGQVGGFSGGNAGDVLVEMGRQQQADVAQQRQLAASGLTSLLGLLGGI